MNIESKKMDSYGTGGSTSAIQNVKGSENMAGNYSSYNGEMIDDRIIGGPVNVVLYERFYLCRLGETKTIPLTKKNLVKMFPSAADFINSYFSEHRPNLEKFDQAKLIVTLCNEQVKKTY
jgi:hypothetical protein